jgi:hypothetical protein
MMHTSSYESQRFPIGAVVQIDGDESGIPDGTKAVILALHNSGENRVLELASGKRRVCQTRNLTLVAATDEPSVPAKRSRD